MEYKISKGEINRRKKAYAALSISLMVGLFSASTIFNYPVPVIGYILVFISLFLIGVFSFGFFHSLSQTKISLSGQSLIRVNNQLHEEYLLEKINRVKIKWTTNKTIREIYIWLIDGKSIFLTGLDRFENFRKDLLGKLNNNIHAKETHELLNFDHQIFYPVLGVVISGVGVFVIKIIANLNPQSLKLLLFISFIYMFILGLYFIIARPISKRLMNKKKIIDWIIGLIMICAGICLLLSGFSISQFTPSILSQ
jgi:hypothetical protein